MNGIHLNGIMGSNPLGFFAALGVQVVFEHQLKQNKPSLWWSDEIVPHAVIDEGFPLDSVAECAMSEFSEWAKSIHKLDQLIRYGRSSKIKEMKLHKDDVRKCIGKLLQKPESNKRAISLISCLIAEGSLDKKNLSKPTDFYFTAGQQKFLESMLKILENVEYDAIYTALNQAWPYKSELPSLRWDISDIREYALRATDPSSDKKLTNPGPEALAILGLNLYPVFGSRGRTLTTGCSGKWKDGYFSWPLWNKPTKINTTRTLISHAHGEKNMREFTGKRDRWFRSWGVFRIYGASIMRTDQGGYGSFSPPEIIWSLR